MFHQSKVILNYFNQSLVKFWLKTLEYVKKYDPHWSYEREAACEEETEEYTIYCVKMYSQKWLDTSVWYSETHENSIWWHYQTIIVPKVSFFNETFGQFSAKF